MGEFNRAFLDRYLEIEGGRELMKDLIELFKRTGPERLTSLQLALMASQHKEAAFLLHSLKNSYLNLGAQNLAQECEDFSKTLLQHSPGENMERFSKLRGASDSIQFELNQLV